MIDRKSFLKIYWLLQKYIVPNLQYSQHIYEQVLNSYCTKGIKWLDLGCGHHILPPWRLKQEKELVKLPNLVIGLDYDYPSLVKHKTIKNLVCGDINHLPFPDDLFDLVTANMVFEHLNNPQQSLNEISRVLKIGGKLIFHTPNKWGYTTLASRMIPEKIKDKLIYILQGRSEEDVFPTFYRINSLKEIEKMAQSSGFKVIEIKLICSSAQFAIIPPLALFELIWIKFLMSKIGKYLRTNIIAILEKA